jgi:hypothetical protein
MPVDPAGPAGDLDDLLDRAQAALRRGAFDELPDLSAAIETRLADGLAPLVPAAAAGLRARAERNALCLEAAGRGLRAASRRLREIRAVAQGLATYGEDGLRQRLLAAPGRLDTRA